MSNSKEIFKEGDDVYCHLRGHGFVQGINLESINVQFCTYGDIVSYTKDGKPMGQSIINPTLSHTKYKLEGFSQRQSIKKGQLIYVKQGIEGEWVMRFFDKFSEDNGVMVIGNQKTIGPSVKYQYYSVTNPLMM